MSKSAQLAIRKATLTWDGGNLEKTPGFFARFGLERIIRLLELLMELTLR